SRLPERGEAVAEPVAAADQPAQAKLVRRTPVHEARVRHVDRDAAETAQAFLPLDLVVVDRLHLREQAHRVEGAAADQHVPSEDPPLDLPLLAAEIELRLADRAPSAEARIRALEAEGDPPAEARDVGSPLGGPDERGEPLRRRLDVVVDEDQELARA